MKNVLQPPVFIIGSSRSGTTLLYSILMSSGSFAIYQAETLLLNVCRPKYGSLKKDKNYKQFITDWIHSKQFARSGLDVDDFLRAAGGNRSSYLEFLDFFLGSIAKCQGKKRWAEQTPGHLFYMDELATAYPKAKFIHMIRDGRDVALSRRALGWTGTKSKDLKKKLLSAALSWEICIKQGRAYGDRIGDNYLEIKYEELVKDLENTLEKINIFLGTSVTRDQLRKSNIGSLQKGNTSFGDDIAGISSKAINRWKKQLRQDETQVLHFAIGSTLLKLGYDVPQAGLTKKNIRNIEQEINVCLLKGILRIKRLLKEKSFLGRFSSDTIELGEK